MSHINVVIGRLTGDINCQLIVRETLIQSSLFPPSQKINAERAII